MTYDESIHRTGVNVGHLCQGERRAEANLHSTMDGRAWAEEFMRLHEGKTIGKEFDLGDAIGWMANAIMCGWDHAHRKTDEASP